MHSGEYLQVPGTGFWMFNLAKPLSSHLWLDSGTIFWKYLSRPLLKEFVSLNALALTFFSDSLDSYFLKKTPKSDKTHQIIFFCLFNLSFDIVSDINLAMYEKRNKETFIYLVLWPLSFLLIKFVCRHMYQPLLPTSFLPFLSAPSPSHQSLPHFHNYLFGFVSHCG